MAAPVIGLMLATGSMHRVHAVAAPVTYSRQIAPIVYRSCSGCHHAGGSGPFALTSYAEAKRWGGLMEEVTQSRYMPPWLPEPGHGDFEGSRRLPADEIALIKQWVEGGMPEGDAAEAPKPPVYTNEWQLGPPDLVLEVDSPTEVPASGTDLFRSFLLPTSISQTRWVRAMEIKPGSPQVVHHANLLIDRTASLRRQHPAEWRQGIAGMDINVDAGDAFDPDSHFLDWKPDSSALVELPGMPWRLDPGNDLVLNMHLKPTGKVETVRARVGLYFTDRPAERLPMLLQLEHDAALNIPAGDANFVVEDELRLPEAVEVLAIYPHAHYLGKRLEGWATLPNGRREELILISSWDISRQAIYRFRTPVSLPRGSVVHMRYAYDNSAANPRNPNTPAIRVTAGNRSVDEMGHLWLQVLPRPEAGASGDARAPLMEAWMRHRLERDPADATALFNLGSIEESDGHVAEAEQLFRRAAQVRPEDVRITTALGSALVKAGDWKQGRATFVRAIAADGSYGDARFDLALVDLEHGETVEAEAQFRALLAAHPDDATAHAGLGSVLLAGDHAADARAEFEAAVRLDPANFEAVYNLATIEAGAGEVDAATTHLKMAESLRPADADTHRGLVAMYAQAGQLAEAIREQKEVVRLDPSRAEEWNNLGVLHVRSGDRAAARGDFEHALRLDPGNAVARSDLARL